MCLGTWHRRSQGGNEKGPSLSPGPSSQSGAKCFGSPLSALRLLRWVDKPQRHQTLRSKPLIISCANNMAALRLPMNWWLVPYAYWNKVVPGDTSETMWTDYLSFDELPKSIDPPAGFHQNAAGSNAAHEGKMISVNYCRDHLASTYRYT